MGVAAGLVPKGLGAQYPTEKFIHCMDLLVQQLSQKIIFMKENKLLVLGNFRETADF